MRGAIFDMDGVLFDTERLYQKTWREVGSEMGVTLPEEFTYAVSGAAKNGVLASVRKFYHTDDPEQVITEVYERMRRRQESALPIKSGVIEFLTALKEADYRLAVASSTYHDQVVKNLERNGLFDFFDEVIGGNEVKRAKPDPDIFLLAAERLSLAPSDCYVFEDSFNGIRAAHAAGTVAVMVIDLMRPDDEIRGLADYVFEDMGSVLTAFRAGDCLEPGMPRDCF